MSRSFEVTRGQKSQIRGQISIFFKSRQIIYQNEALGISFSGKLISRSFEISIYFKRRQVIPQNEALELIFSKRLVLRSFEVIHSHVRSKISKKVKFLIIYLKYDIFIYIIF